MPASLCILGRLGGSGRASGAVGGGLGGVLGGPGGRLGTILGALGVWEASWDHFGRSWDILTPILAPFGLLLGDPKIPLFA